MNKPGVVLCRSNPVDPDPRVIKQAHTLTQAGYPVMIIGWDRTGDSKQFEEVRGLEIQRIFIPAKFGQGIFNLLSLIRWQFNLFRWLFIQRNHYRVIHACDFDTVIPSLACKILLNKHVIYDIFDFFSDNINSVPALFKLLIKKADLLIMGWVDAVILVDHARRQQIAEARPKRIAYIYNTPQDLPKAHNRNIKREKHFNSANLHLAYVGQLQYDRGLFELCEVLQKHPQWHLCLAGFGSGEKALVRNALQIPNISWKGKVTYDEALDINSKADILVATYDPQNPNNQYASPNKLFEAMMLGKPIIVARNTNIDRIVEENRMGLVIEYGSISELEKAILLLENDSRLLHQLGKNARDTYENSYPWRLMQDRLLFLYQSVLDN